MLICAPCRSFPDPYFFFCYGRNREICLSLEADIPAKEEQLKRLKVSVTNVDAFIEKAKQYTAIDEMPPQLLRLFIQRIEIGERSKKHFRSAVRLCA